MRLTFFGIVAKYFPKKKTKEVVSLPHLLIRSYVDPRFAVMKLVWSKEINGSTAFRLAKKRKESKTQVLSQTARATLIMYILTIITSYYYQMSSFQLPKNICHKIEAKLRYIFQGYNPPNNHLYVRPQESLCKPKIVRGLGFRNLESKVGWVGLHPKMLTKHVSKFPNPNTSSSRPLFSNTNLGKKIKIKKSSIWNGICKAIPLINRGLCYLLILQIYWYIDANIWHDS